MDISKILTDVILLERGLKTLYENIAANTDNAETARTLRILSTESGAHAKVLESRYQKFVKSEVVDKGSKDLLSLLSERIAKMNEKAGPVEVLREGIEIEGHMEQLYKGLADNYKQEEEFDKSLGKVQKEAPKIVEIFMQIAADERRHQHILQSYVSKIVKAE